MDNNKWIWIAWEKQRRTLELSRTFNCKLYIFNYYGILRYPKCILLSTKVIIANSKNVIIVQNPSMVLAALACVLKMIFNNKVIVDRHSTFALKKNKITVKRMVFLLFHKFTIRKADLTIVTNRYLANIVNMMNGKSFVLPDKLPEFSTYKTMELKEGFNIFFIASFNKDEPIYEVIKAASKLTHQKINIYISGNYKKTNLEFKENVPSNVIFIGYVSDDEFVNYLHSVDAAMVLTTSEYCLLCGCYEAVAAEKPLITSNKKVLYDYFEGSAFVDEKEQDIINGIMEVVSNYWTYKKNVKLLKNNIKHSWNKKYNELLRTIDEVCNESKQKYT